MSEHPYDVVDVFTATRFAGNPLAVVTDARGLDGATMQAIAREFNFAETSFVSPPADAANDAHVRIFTPAAEMPFAGHPNVGTAFTLGRMGTLWGRPIGDTLRFEEAAGLVEVTLRRDGGIIVGAGVRAPRALEIGTEAPREAIAELAGLAATAIIDTVHPPRFASVGAQFLFAQVGAAALDDATYDTAAFARWAPLLGGERLLSLHLYHRDGDDVRARMFAPLDGIAEDPATGSAAAALGALLAHLHGQPQRFAVHQGAHVGRPSRIDVRADADGVSIGGDCVAVMRGVLRV